MKKVSSILIVGGGSAGWMSAAYLSRRLQGVQVTLVESEKMPPIGVGEATTPMMRHFLAAVGFSSPESWMPQCEATFKTGIFFENWYEPGDHYWHPFESLDYIDDRYHVGHSWLAEQADGRGGYRDRHSFYERHFASTALNVGQNKMPHHPDIAYHFDAARFGQLLRQAADGVKHILDEIVWVELDDAGDIAAVATAEHGMLSADLYIDCTGFRRQLTKKVAPTEPFRSAAKALFNDRAVVARMRWDPDVDLGRQVFPYVKATARSAGWIWSIPLFDRLSCGYVYSSSFISDEDATRELERHCGPNWDRAAELFPVKFMTGKLAHLWIKNCVAIGLAGGFVEPLESSGLAITQVGIELLASILDARYYDPPAIERYNLALDKCYADVIHFIIAHYCLTRREDTPYWAAVKHEALVPPELVARLEVFQRYLPTTDTKGLREGTWAFRDLSWFCVLLGMNFPFHIPKLPERAMEEGARLAREKRRLVEEMSAKLPEHYRFLESRVYGRAKAKP
jgi:tryptophan halogenase